MDCSKFSRLISMHVDGEIKPGDAGELNYHMMSCGHCRQEAERLKKLKTMLGAADRKAAGAYFESKLAARLENPARASARTARLALRLIPACAAFLLILGAVKLQFIDKKAVSADESQSSLCSDLLEDETGDSFNEEINTIYFES